MSWFCASFAFGALLMSPVQETGRCTKPNCSQNPASSFENTGGSSPPLLFLSGPVPLPFLPLQPHLFCFLLPLFVLNFIGFYLWAGLSTNVLGLGLGKYTELEAVTLLYNIYVIYCNTFKD